MALRDAQVVRLLDSYRTVSGAIRKRVIDQAAGMWNGLGSWRDADINSFTTAVVPLVRAGRRQQASLTDAYLASMARAAMGTGTPVGISDAVLDGIRNGTPLDEVYRRPGVTVWTAVADGVPWEAAAARGLNRLTSMLATDMQLARTFTAREVFSNDRRVIGYMRVTSGACCELCDLASDNSYSSEDLMPIHNNCNCDVEPLYADHDSTDLSQRQASWVAREAGGTVVSDEGDTPEVREHGELGPVLTVKGQNFTSVDDLAA